MAKGVETLVVPNDLGEEPQVSAAINAALNRLGRLDSVMSNAGVPGTDDTSIDVIDLESYRRLMRVNVDGIFYVTRNTIPYLAETAGNLIFVGSFDGHYPCPRRLTYTASK